MDVLLLGPGGDGKSGPDRLERKHWCLTETRGSTKGCPGGSTCWTSPGEVGVPVSPNCRDRNAILCRTDLFRGGSIRRYRGSVRTSVQGHRGHQ